MNLFILAWNPPDGLLPSALAELRHMAEVYPQLDPTTLWHYNNEDEMAFAASMHTAEHAATPRRYVFRSHGHVTFYDGCLIDRVGGFQAHNAEALSSQWAQLPEALEGRFVAVRITRQPSCLELLIDPLGMAQVYYLHQGNVWLISNSVRLLMNLSKTRVLDPLGVSLLLTLGWAGADRTLQREIHVIPGGQRWIWQPGQREPRREVYFDPSMLARRRQRALTRAEYERLGEELMHICSTLAQSYGELQCPLTGGRDSRLMAALLIRGGIKAKYHTFGPADNPDIPIGAQIAQAFDLPYKARIRTAEDNIKLSDAAIWRFIQQNDGMAKLETIFALRNYPSLGEYPFYSDRLSVTLAGTGGEIARGYYSHPKLFLGRHGVKDLQRSLTGRVVRGYDGLVRWEALALAQAYVQRYVEQAIEVGVAPLDVPDLFYVSERVRRWAGSLHRIVMPIFDPVSPFCTRPFVEAAFRLPAWHRYTEPIHYQLMQLLVPELQRIPFDKPWRSQRPVMNIVRWIGQQGMRKASEPIRRVWRRQPSGEAARVPAVKSPSWREVEWGGWLETQYPRWRELCLDQAESALWSFVNRPLFERITSPAATPAERRRCLQGLYNVATLFYYTQVTGS